MEKGLVGVLEFGVVLTHVVDTFQGSGEMRVVFHGGSRVSGSGGVREWLVGGEGSLLCDAM